MTNKKLVIVVGVGSFDDNISPITVCENLNQAKSILSPILSKPTKENDEIIVWEDITKVDKKFKEIFKDYIGEEYCGEHLGCCYEIQAISMNCCELKKFVW